MNKISGQWLLFLVTGASGFAASWVVKENISRSYFVRGTVRSVPKGEYLKKLFGDQFEYVLVEDLAKEGIFDEAVKNVDAVVHMASPVTFDVQDPRELIRPAVGGTLSILRSILKHGLNVKRVVLTSSFGAIVPFPQPGDPQKRYDESSWNNAADLITIQPSFINGPIIHQVSSPPSLNESSATVLRFFKNIPLRSNKDLSNAAGGIVDVRDVAWAHVEAITDTKIASKDAQAALTEGKGRIALVAACFTWQDVVDALVDAGILLPESTPRGEKGAGKNAYHPVLVDSVRAKEELGMKFRSLTESFGDALKDFQQKGWL
ncbi:hypothetical protein M422DRAFT_40027 [Sphaerobolus stellatus SS14]|uniref:NAD-dependent epimerase/dehydratase domain-containing protein n=1 Tax=Sphaerobolus stellatus (strain SS14) TaxID=990650 RepID=A0A0C9T1B6_SPHS4|nr:hypothetical protein M422DRAFT_40027 [Sphaerobolus stellatus SS14]